MQYLENGEALATIGYFMNRRGSHPEAIDCYQRAIRYGFAESTTEKETRGSRRMSFAFHVVSEVHTST